MDKAPNLASAADDITAQIICAVVRIAPLLGGDGVLADMKKCPPAQLRAFLSFK
jgi:hypothetical protein